MNVVITGATGNIGSRIVADLLPQSDVDRITVLVRGDGHAMALSRMQNALSVMEPDLDMEKVRKRIQVLPGDVTKENMGLGGGTYRALCRDTTHILHSAAVTSHTSSLELLQRTNGLGTRNVMKFALDTGDRGKLRKVGHVSTAFVCGTREGRIIEDDFGARCFANHYQHTKWEAEEYVRSLIGRLPLVVFRPSIVVGDSSSGRICTLNVLYQPLKWIYEGMLRVLPGSPEIPLDVVPVDFASAAIRHILLTGEVGTDTICHVAAGPDRSSTVGEVVDLGIRYFRSEESCEAVRSMRYLPAALMSRSLDRKVVPLHPDRVRASLESLRIFGPYITVSRNFDVTNLRAALAGTGLAPPRYREYSSRLLDYCFATDWGRAVERSA